MESLFAFGSMADKALLVALCTARIAVAFLLVPLFTGDLIPATVRNAIYLAFGVLALAMQPPFPPDALYHVHWIPLFAKEALIGGGIGFLFGTVLWAFEAAGQLIDTKVGATTAQVTDPLSGQQTPLTGAFLGRLANFVFMFSGGLLLFTGTLLDSYRVWPALSPLPRFDTGGFVVFENELGRLMLVALLVAAPSLVVLFAIDAMLGLVNRYAPNLNVFALSMSLKTWASTLVLMLTLGALVQHVIDDVHGRPALVLRALRSVFGG